MIVTCAEMKEIEKKADANGVSYYQMMENAGTAAFRIIMEDGTPSSAAVYCGKGNNGGDGFVIARLLRNKGVKVQVCLVDGEPKTTDAITNFGLLENIEVTDEPEGDIIVDAIYGTGFHGAFRKQGGAAVKRINGAGKKVYAIDIPSGLSGDMTDGDSLENEPVKAYKTIAFHSMKPVHICEQAKPYLGEVITASIGIEDVI